jgi:hypothetical protein
MSPLLALYVVSKLRDQGYCVCLIQCPLGHENRMGTFTAGVNLPKAKSENFRRPMLENQLCPREQERGAVDAKVRDLALIAGVACFALMLAWSYEADFFAIFFATAAAIAIIEAVRRSV